MKKIILKTEYESDAQLLLNYVMHYRDIMIDKKEGFYNFTLWDNDKYQIVVYHTKTSIIGSIKTHPEI